MATDLSLSRLRELLQLACGSCEGATEAVNEILNTLPFEGRIGEWWKENSKTIGKALGYSFKAERQMANAATLCDQDFSGDAEQLRIARDELVQQLTKINEFYHPASDSARTHDWTVESDLWAALYFRVSAADTAARSLLESESVKIERQLSQHRDAPEKSANGSNLLSDLISFDNLAKLLGHTTKKRLQNAVVDWRKAGHTIDDPCSYTAIRPLVLDTWKDKARMFPLTLDEAKCILKNLG